MAELGGERKKKGKNFGAEEECQLCWSFLAISQEPVTGTGQKSMALWKRIMDHYNANRPTGTGSRPWRSLESKWATIKGDVAKFSGVYAEIAEGLGDSITSTDDMLKRALELYCANSPKNANFHFVHCWEILKDAPKWSAYKELESTPSMKRKSIENDLSMHSTSVHEGVSSPAIEGTPSGLALGPTEEFRADTLKDSVVQPQMKVNGDLVGEDVSSPAAELSPSLSFRLASRPKRVKEELRAATLKDSALKAQAKATSELAVATLERNAILKDQAALALFTIPTSDLLEEDAKEYLALRRAEELQILKARLAARKPSEDIMTAVAPVPNVVHVDAPLGNSSAPVSASSAVDWMESDTNYR